eukprot:CAMPEP_0175177072 /NCGR_PEP_ID=MMETSP0087-20121206/34172_1 /TAXON_ID=136419 /ORGANISM="Unknown Unknown, Strain D1" /LENGTH=860 /DNA_ID=CAMNT_0016468987 /DNA_START=511 /DNA_END=3093 /DNA_ORIENTATION=+
MAMKSCIRSLLSGSTGINFVESPAEQIMPALSSILTGQDSQLAAHSPSVLVSVLVTLLRSLSESVLTSGRFPEFCLLASFPSSRSKKNPQNRADLLAKLLNKLPPVNVQLLSELATIFQRCDQGGQTAIGSALQLDCLGQQQDATDVFPLSAIVTMLAEHFAENPFNSSAHQPTVPDTSVHAPKNNTLTNYDIAAIHSNTVPVPSVGVPAPGGLAAFQQEMADPTNFEGRFTLYENNVAYSVVEERLFQVNLRNGATLQLEAEGTLEKLAFMEQMQDLIADPSGTLKRNNTLSSSAHSTLNRNGTLGGMGAGDTIDRYLSSHLTSLSGGTPPPAETSISKRSVTFAEEHQVFNKTEVSVEAGTHALIFDCRNLVRLLNGEEMSPCVKVSVDFGLGHGLQSVGNTDFVGKTCNPVFSNPVMVEVGRVVDSASLLLEVCNVSQDSQGYLFDKPTGTCQVPLMTVLKNRGKWTELPLLNSNPAINSQLTKLGSVLCVQAADPDKEPSMRREFSVKVCKLFPVEGSQVEVRLRQQSKGSEEVNFIDNDYTDFQPFEMVDPSKLPPSVWASHPSRTSRFKKKLNLRHFPGKRQKFVISVNVRHPGSPPFELGTTIFNCDKLLNMANKPLGLALQNKRNQHLAGKLSEEGCVVVLSFLPAKKENLPFSARDSEDPTSNYVHHSDSDLAHAQGLQGAPPASQAQIMPQEQGGSPYSRPYHPHSLAGSLVAPYSGYSRPDFEDEQELRNYRRELHNDFMQFLQQSEQSAPDYFIPDVPNDNDVYAPWEQKQPFEYREGEKPPAEQRLRVHYSKSKTSAGPTDASFGLAGIRSASGNISSNAQRPRTEQPIVVRNNRGICRNACMKNPF